VAPNWAILGAARWRKVESHEKLSGTSPGFPKASWLKLNYWENLWHPEIFCSSALAAPFMFSPCLTYDMVGDVREYLENIPQLPSLKLCTDFLRKKMPKYISWILGSKPQYTTATVYAYIYTVCIYMYLYIYIYVYINIYITCALSIHVPLKIFLLIHSWMTSFNCSTTWLSCTCNVMPHSYGLVH
jgi:hypothetical protein